MYQEKGDLNYQVENLVETLRYCRPRNGFLINKSNAEIADLLWDAVRETVGDLAAAIEALIQDSVLIRAGGVGAGYRYWLGNA